MPASETRDATHSHWRKQLERCIDSLVQEYGAERACDVIIAYVELVQTQHGVQPLVEPRE